MLISYLQQLFGNSTTLEKVMMKEINEDKQTVSNEGAEIRNGSFEKDIRALEERFGRLKAGMKIEIGLQDLLLICPRNRRKTDAFYMLTKTLKTAYGVELEIKSRHNRQEDE